MNERTEQLIIPEKKTKPHKLPYPDGLLLALGMTGPFSEDQIDGLYYVVRELSLREKEIIRMRYVEHMTYHAIADTCGLTCSRIRQITVKALHKLGRASAACYYTDGYRYTQDRIRKEEEHKARLLQEKSTSNCEDERW